MRISERMKSSFMVSDLQRSLDRMVKTQRDIATSTTIHKPSDDPNGTSKVIRLKGQISRYNRYQSNIEDSQDWLEATESSLSTTLDIISDVNAILLQGANGSIGAAERDTLGERVKEYLNDAVDLANRDYGGKHLFGGTATDQQPYTRITGISDESFTSAHDTGAALDSVDIVPGSMTVTDTGGTVTYTEGTDYTVDYEEGTVTVLSTGSMADASEYLVSYETEDAQHFEVNAAGINGRVMREIDEGITMQINISGSEVFGGGQGLFSVLKEAYTALKRNDLDGIDQAREQLTGQVDTVTGILGEVGAKINRLDALSQRMDSDITGFEQLISSVEDTDIAEALITLQNDQAVYQAALKTGADIIQSTLLDYL